MNSELTIGAINSGYGGLPIGVAAALGGASLAWHAHPGQAADCPGRAVMRFHHPHAIACDLSERIPPMVDVLTVNRYDAGPVSAGALIGAGYKPPVVIVETASRRGEAVPVCAHLRSRGYRAAWQTMRAADVGAPHRRPRVYVIGVRGDCQAPGINAAYLDATPWTGTMWPTPDAYNTHLDVTAYRWSIADLEGQADSRALEHWEKVTGERYPYPLYTLPTATTGAGGLSLGFVEWMMGLPVGYVSTPSLPLTHDQRMALLYSGTVPLQAAHAVATGMKRVYQQ
nr:MAG TPA: Cytosine specific methyltransferase [Caudoviricetes sp.]